MVRFYVIFIIFIFHSCNVKYRTSGLDDFEFLWSTVDKYYPYLEFKNINWDSVYVDYKPKFKRVNNKEKIQLLSEMIDLLQDGHADLRKNGRKVSSYQMPRSVNDKELFSKDVVWTYFTNDLNKVDIFEYGTSPDSVGYIQIDTWHTNDTIIAKFDDIIYSLRNTKGLIIDLRHNKGGNSKYGYYVFQRLLKEPINGFKWTYENGDFTPIVTYSPEGDYQYTNPTVILINGVSFSVSENIANLSKNVEQITLIGETTAGGGGIPKYFQLPSGYIFKIPTRTMLRYDDEQVEWNGIPPDIFIKNNQVELNNGKDNQLEYAIKYLE